MNCHSCRFHIYDYAGFEVSCCLSTSRAYTSQAKAISVNNPLTRTIKIVMVHTVPCNLGNIRTDFAMDYNVPAGKSCHMHAQCTKSGSQFFAMAWAHRSYPLSAEMSTQ